MTAADPSRLDRLEALAETILLSIQALSQKQDRTQEQLDQYRAETDRKFEVIDRKFDAIEEERRIFAEQTAVNAAGMVELRNLIADFIRAQAQ